MWVAVTVCMTGIILLWIWSLGGLGKAQPQISRGETGELFGALGQIKKEIPTLWQSLGAGIGDVFKSIKEETQKLAEPSPSPETEKKTIEEKLPIE